MIKKVVAVAAATGGLVMAGAGMAVAQGADGGAVGSPGVVSGNNLQAPVTVPVELCGNTFDFIGLMNPVYGNACL
jgi:hypothetical protein